MAIAGLYKIFDRWHREGSVYICSDPHFGDPDLAHLPGRPPADELVRLINSKVGRKDTLIILGDIYDPSYVAKLRGYKVLIMGNHDSGRTNYERNYWIEWFDQDKYTREGALAEMRTMYPNCHYTISGDFNHSWEIKADNMLFDEVYEGPLMIAEKLILSHEPVQVPWAHNLHGHNHVGTCKDKNHTNVCLDVTGYLPVNLNQWMKQGHFAHIPSIHRTTIDTATIRKAKRGGKKIGEK